LRLVKDDKSVLSTVLQTSLSKLKRTKTNLRHLRLNKRYNFTFVSGI